MDSENIEKRKFPYVKNNWRLGLIDIPRQVDVLLKFILTAHQPFWGYFMLKA